MNSSTSAHPDDAALLEYVNFAQMHSMTDRVGQFIDKRFERASAASDNPQLQAKREAFRELFAAILNVAQGGKPPIEAMQRLANASGPRGDPEKEQRRQMFLERLRLAGAASQAGLPDGLMPSAKPASGRFRLRESVVVPGQEYLISGTCSENSVSGDHTLAEQDRCVIAKGHNEPTFVISAKSDDQIHRELEKRALLMIFGGAAVALACAAGLLFHSGLL